MFSNLAIPKTLKIFAHLLRPSFHPLYNELQGVYV